MTSMAADARRRLLEHLAALKRSLATIPKDVVETEAALQRIDKGTYGRCESCGGAIGRQRLLALPATRYCIACSAGACKTGL